MAKEYHIKTVQDMIDCTNEDNLEDFLIDLKGFLTSAHMFQAIVEDVGETKKEIESDGFIWTDDGKHNVAASIGVKNQNNN